jgi:NADPH-ferrihemoprotein reductase
VQLTDSRLEEMGASRVYVLGLGDDDGDLEADFEQWRDGLWPALQAAAGADASPSSAGGSAAGAGAIDSRRRGTSEGVGGDETELPDLPAFTWAVTPLPGPPAGVSAAAAASGEPTAPAGTPAAAAAASRADMSARHFFQAVPVPVAVNRELRQATGVGASTRHVELDLAGSGVSYMTADNLYVLPENEPELVARVAAACDFDLDAWIGLEPAAAGAGGDGTAPAPLFPAPVSVRTLISRYVDLSGEPRKDLLGHLAHFAGAPAERARLLRLASRAGREEFTSWVRGSQRSVYELFDAFPSLKVPLAAFVHIMPRLQPRAYTIASSSLVQPSRVAIVASVLDAEKPGAEAGRRLRGVCSNYMLRSAGTAAGGAVASPVSRGPGAAAASVPRMWVTVKPSTFRLPKDARTPVIMIGPGTGIAPFRGFLQERAHLRALGKAVGPAFLYFGCQARDRDYVYREELDAWVRDGTLTGLYTAFSREQERKIYVQHLLAERRAEVADLIVGQNASVYVCGATRMGHDVADALQAILSTHPGGGVVAGAADAVGPGAAPMRAEDAKAYLSRMHAEARYVQELWSS